MEASDDVGTGCGSAGACEVAEPGVRATSEVMLMVLVAVGELRFRLAIEKVRISLPLFTGLTLSIGASLEPCGRDGGGLVGEDEASSWPALSRFSWLAMRNRT